MNTLQWPPRVGASYVRWDKREVFQVTGYDETTGKARIESFDGDVSEMDEVMWRGLPLVAADPAEDWAGPVETVDVVRFDEQQNGPVSEDISGPSTRTD